MSAEITSPPPLREFPPEIWLTIFRLATFIPLETDLSVPTVELGLFCSNDGYLLLALKQVLPLRRAITQVSRRFYQIGAEVLYTTFHVSPWRVGYPDLRFSLFADLLVSRPELGRFVKRLSLRWSDAEEEKNHQVISHCPNVLIFSSVGPGSYVGQRPWWGRGLPKTIRSFDASVYRVPMNDILALLQMLPHLELLHLRGLTGYPSLDTPVSLSALRVLSIYRS